MAKILTIFALALTLALAKEPAWLQYGAKIIAEFTPHNAAPIQSFKDGFGLFVNDNLVLTSAKIVYDLDTRSDALDILLYLMENPGEPASCLSHARLIALDDKLDLAILKVERFTDIYCNILPNQNFRITQKNMIFYDLLRKPLELKLSSHLPIMYFTEYDWSEFMSVSSTLGQFLDKGERMLGMPIFTRSGVFLGIHTSSGILSHKQILSFICKLNATTSVLRTELSFAEYCEKQ